VELPRKIFREYDIRGLVDRDITPEGVRSLGTAVAGSLLRDGISQALCPRA
jgi:phosphomannomutase/phosphoglucomutase